MKTFFRILWTVIKVVLFSIGCVTVLGVLLILGLVLLAGVVNPERHRIEDKSVLVFDLSTSITDRPADELAQAKARLFGNNEACLELRQATTALRDAAKDKRISALYLHGNLRVDGYSSGYGALKELRGAIDDFRKSGKPVIAYISDADNRDYYVASAADQILLNPVSEIAFRGLAAQGVFIKGAADKYGLEFTPTRHGKYKSAVEPLIRTNFSPENREQIEAFLKAIWGDVRDTVAGARKISPEQLQEIVDKEGLISAKSAKEHGLVTDLGYEEQALEKLRVIAGKGSNDTWFPQVSIAQYAGEMRLPQFGRDKVAVLYAEGDIVDGSQKLNDRVEGNRYAKLVRDLRQRKDIKALVLRVNSPGGSGQASEVILDELRRFDAEKPVIVSMGTVAASGGYYISMASRKIFAEPSTITGSIGVFGLMMNAKTIANDHGITFDSVKTGELAELGTITRPQTPEEQEVLQNLVDGFYNIFIQRVATCRKMTTNQVDALAQGRVWSGADALKNKLVDELGGLQEAIDDAAKEAKLGSDYSVVEFPEPKPLVEQLTEAIQGTDDTMAGQGIAGHVLQMAMQEWRWFCGLNDPHGVYTRLPFDLLLN